MVQRLTYRGRHSYATKSNQHRVVKTPVSSVEVKEIRAIRGSFTANITYVISYLSPLLHCSSELMIPHLRPAEYKRSRLSRNRRTVNRPYGGVLSGGAVRERIIRAFLVEEQKIVKKVLKIQKAKEKIAAKS
ncbi:hypothetical protein BUALT_Bualt02G0150900 [Buddleja alternifolia]|uniref:60S ribosomal protein L34 n=1 Tax=Buddleja alternifolia TaxID=168488 RepID=A0AAV6Y1W7_9LAMI|nr:hypothetical protein BUALT_Bualt02G0150900 [Buddleja alternifolia]